MKQSIQVELEFPSTPAGEAREAGSEEIESLSTVNNPESPASHESMDGGSRERENLKKAGQRVKGQ